MPKLISKVSLMKLILRNLNGKVALNQDETKIADGSHDNSLPRFILQEMSNEAMLHLVEAALSIEEADHDDDSVSSSESETDLFDNFQQQADEQVKGQDENFEATPAHEFLHDLSGALNKFTDKENELDKAITYHFSRGKARYESDNETGALLSMRKVERLQEEHARLVEVIQYLGTLEVQTVMQLCRRALYASNNVDQFPNFSKRVDEILQGQEAAKPQQDNSTNAQDRASRLLVKLEKMTVSSRCGSKC